MQPEAKCLWPNAGKWGTCSFTATSLFEETSLLIIASWVRFAACELQLIVHGCMLYAASVGFSDLAGGLLGQGVGCEAMGNLSSIPAGGQCGHGWMISPIALTCRHMNLMKAFGLPPIMLPACILADVK